MTLTLVERLEAVSDEGDLIVLWKFRDDKGNLWRTETPESGTEQQARDIILANLP